MNTPSGNPWHGRYESLLDRDVIKQRALVEVPPLIGLKSMPTELAVKKMEAALKAVFYPTNQCVDFLLRCMGVAFAHCYTYYPDSKSFLHGIYYDLPLPEYAFPILLTGLGGSGKTQLAMALRRIQPPDCKILVGAESSPFLLKGSWHVTVRARTGPTDILRALAHSAAGTNEALIRACRKEAYRDGIPLLVTDEYQFSTGSDRANTRLAQILLSIGYIGLPWMYIANYSMLIRILRRPEEERQRLCGDPFILLPDHHESVDFQETLKTKKGVCPEYLTFDPVGDAKAIHSYTAGRNRAINMLLLHTLRREHPRGKVDIAAIQRTYHSHVFASYRAESEILAKQAIQNHPDKKRKDLWCPIPLSKGATEKFTEAVTEKRNQQVADAELRSALNSDERKALKKLEKGAKNKGKKSADVVPLRKKRGLNTADDLKNNANLFKEQLKRK